MKTLTTTSLVTNIDAQKACLILVPILLGLLRSTGRISGILHRSILSLIFNDNGNMSNPRSSKTTSTENTTIKTSESSSSINQSKLKFMPNSNSRFQLQLTKNCQTSNLNLVDFLNPLLQYNELSITALTSTSSYSSLSSSSFTLNPYLETYFAFTMGSSFYNGSSCYALLLSTNELKDLCSLIKKIFVKNLISQINKHLNDYLTQQQNEIFQLQHGSTVGQLQPHDMHKLKFLQAHPYVYKSYSEVLSLVSITLLKDLLTAQSNHGKISKMFFFSFILN